MADNDLKVILKAKELAKHTLRLTSNCNHYPKKFRFSLVDKMQNCPLKENYEQEIRTKAIEEFAEKCNQKITEIILEHQNQITFVSGVSMGWKIIDEIAESMKGEKE